MDGQNPLQPAIDELERDIADLERQWNGLVSAVNILRAKAGLPPHEPAGPTLDGGSGKKAQGGAQSIRPDQFYGKRLGAAAREYLEMRRAQDIGPAKPREIFDALKSGGFQFGSKDEANQMVVLRTMLRKSSQMFHKLPNGSWGLRSWYGNIKQAKEEDQNSETSSTNGGDAAETTSEGVEDREKAAAEPPAAA